MLPLESGRAFSTYFMFAMPWFNSVCKVKVSPFCFTSSSVSCVFSSASVSFSLFASESWESSPFFSLSSAAIEASRLPTCASSSLMRKTSSALSCAQPNRPTAVRAARAMLINFFICASKCVLCILYDSLRVIIMCAVCLERVIKSRRQAIWSSNRRFRCARKAYRCAQ